MEPLRQLRTWAGDRSYQLIADDAGMSKSTVHGIFKADRLPASWRYSRRSSSHAVAPARMSRHSRRLGGGCGWTALKAIESSPDCSRSPPIPSQPDGTTRTAGPGSASRPGTPCPALDALGVVSGAAHTEVIMTDRGPVLIESGARLGGGTAPDIVEKFSGTSQTSLFADTLIDPDELKGFDDAATVWSWAVRNVALINPVAGCVHSLNWTARVEALPTLAGLLHEVTEGELLAETSDLIKSPGYVYLVAEDPEDVERDYRRLWTMEEAGLYTT